jgi:hypothetical protein
MARRAAVALEVAVLELDPGAPGPLGGEQHLDLGEERRVVPPLGVICQASTSRWGGSQTSTLPTSHSLPSSQTPYHRPPAPGSSTDFASGDLPMWCSRGHQRSIPAVNTSKARACEVSTTTCRRTGSIIRPPPRRRP